MTLNINLKGCKQKIEEFILFLRQSPKYSTCDQLNKREDETEVIYAESTQTPCLPTIRDIKTVRMETTDHRFIEIVLLDTEVIEMINDTIIIHGKSYDVYATPAEKR